jgi:hypothetical protein
MSAVFHSLDPSRSNIFLARCCPRCEAGLTFHQPDDELPERLLATCDDCKAWYWTEDAGMTLRPIDDESRDPWG